MRNLSLGVVTLTASLQYVVHLEDNNELAVQRAVVDDHGLTPQACRPDSFRRAAGMSVVVERFVIIEDPEH